jgi:glycerol kinase
LFLTIDQGTTSSRAILFDGEGQLIDSHQIEFKQIYPDEGWVEHNPEDIISSAILCCENVLERNSGEKIESLGITNQRETVVAWDKNNGKPFYNAIVWQDRRTSEFCGNLKKDGLQETINKKTGLLLDPYFSASKISWLLNNVTGLRSKAIKGEVCFGTIDSWLIWNFTKGKVFATDATNASRTSLFNIKTMNWDSDLLDIFNIPFHCLPQVKNSSDFFGETDQLSRSLKITGVIGDQQSSAFGQFCYKEGEVKSTYGTGCFVLANTGSKIIYSKKNLLSTIAYKIDNEVSYAIEGSIFMAGGLMNWAKSNLGIIDDIADSSDIAANVNPASKVVIVPAFSGLGAPHWSSDSKGTIFGMSQATGKEELIHSALQSVSLQTLDLIKAIKDDFLNNNLTLSSLLRVDGGMVENNWFIQNLSNICNYQIQKAFTKESTALGAALISGLGAGYYSGLDDLRNLSIKRDQASPDMDVILRRNIILNWDKAIKLTIDMTK